MKEEFIDEVSRAVNRTWNAIGADAITPTETLTREEVWELCVDADRVVVHGNLSKDDYKKLINLPHEDELKLMEKCLPFTHYGW